LPKRLARTLYLVATGLLVASLACSQTAKHRRLSFFFDGVPAPGGPAAAGAAMPPPGAVLPAPTAVAARLFAHTPYRENRCGGCHDVDSGQLIRPLDEGLCRTCHAVLIRDLPFLHGPVAVDECTACHHYHHSAYPQLLLDTPVATCLKCHDLADLHNEDYHATIETQSCTDCHDAHGGRDRFFLKRSAP
jgi:predicted CXXCH cytochrome family protein